MIENKRNLVEQLIEEGGIIETIARGVCIKNGKVLLCKAKGGKSTYLPGGHIEFGEKAKAALVREMKEETGLDATVGDFLGVVENSFVQHGNQHAEINLIYSMDIATETVNSAECWIEFEWCEVSQLARANLLPIDMHRVILSRIGA